MPPPPPPRRWRQQPHQLAEARLENQTAKKKKKPEHRVEKLHPRVCVLGSIKVLHTAAAAASHVRAAAAAAPEAAEAAWCAWSLN